MISHFIFQNEVIDPEINPKFKLLNKNLNYYILYLELEVDITGPKTSEEIVDEIKQKGYILLSMKTDTDTIIYDVFCKVLSLKPCFGYIQVEVAAPSVSYAIKHNLCVAAIEDRSIN
jgi:hypothetical protein